jgi:hypothetical protein
LLRLVPDFKVAPGAAAESELGVLPN